MRILLWSESFWPRIGGVELLGVHLVKALRERGHEPVVLTSRDTEAVPEEESLDGVRVVRRRFREPQDAADISGIVALRREVVALKRDFRPDVVHVFHVGANVLFHALTIDDPSVPSVVTLHIRLEPALLKPGTAMGLTLRRAAGIATCGASLRDELRARVPELARRTCVIPNRIPRPAAEPAPLAFDPPVVLFLGRLIDQKGFDLGLEAFATAAHRHPEARLIVAGDGPDRSTLERRARELGLAKRVDLRGWVEPAATTAVINEATLVAMPSRFEPYPLVALEAMHLRRPVVAFGVDGLREIVRDGATGRLVAPGDVPAFGEALADLLGDPERTRRLGEAAQEWAIEPPAWDDHVAAYEALYARAAGGS
jgi:glycogen synthase